MKRERSRFWIGWTAYPQRPGPSVRSEADYLRDGIHELRAKHLGVNYRILYFFFAREAVVVSHGVVKQRASVSPKEIERAMRRKRLFEGDPERHTYKEDT